MIIKIILVILVVIILYYLFNIITKEDIIEGVTPEYKVIISNDPLESIKQTASINSTNIANLKTQIDELINLKKEVYDISGIAHANTKGMAGLSDQLASYSNEVSGSAADPNSNKPLPKVTGLGENSNNLASALTPPDMSNN
jgi:hypothetical protein